MSAPSYRLSERCLSRKRLVLSGVRDVISGGSKSLMVNTARLLGVLGLAGTVAPDKIADLVA